MKHEELDRQLAEAKPIISEHWSACLESELYGHNEQAHRAVDKLLQGYFEALKALPEPVDANAILEVMKQLFRDLDQLNAEADGALLETDERELLVPIVNSAAEVVGLPIHEYENDDPTFEFRNF